MAPLLKSTSEGCAQYITLLKCTNILLYPVKHSISCLLCFNHLGMALPRYIIPLMAKQQQHQRRTPCKDPSVMCNISLLYTLLCPTENKISVQINESHKTMVKSRLSEPYTQSCGIVSDMETLFLK